MNAYSEIKEMLTDISGLTEIEKEAVLETDLGLDSFDMVTLLLRLEEILKVELDESDMNPFALITVGDVMRLAEKYETGTIANNIVN